jgi:hypothetical protein
LLYNRIGRRIYRVGGTVYPSVWEDPRNVLDLQVGLKVFKAKGEFKLNVGDILNEQSVFYFDRNSNKKFTAGIDDAITRSKFGRNVSISFSHSL